MLKYLRSIIVMFFVFSQQIVFPQSIGKTSILILATPHLRIMTKGDLDKSLELLNLRMLNYKPDAVCLEIFSPAEIEKLLNDVNPNAKKYWIILQGTQLKLLG